MDYKKRTRPAPPDTTGAGIGFGGFKKQAMKWQAESTGHPDIVLAMEAEKRVVTVLDKLIDAKSKAALAWMKWVENEPNAAIKELFKNLIQVDQLWLQLHKTYSEQYEVYRNTFKYILHGEMALDKLRKETDVYTMKVNKLERQVLEARAKKAKSNSRRLEDLTVEFVEAQSAKNHAEKEYEGKAETSHQYKFGKVRDALNTLAGANQMLHDGCSALTLMQQQLKELFLASPSGHVSADSIFYANQESQGMINDIAKRLDLTYKRVAKESRRRQVANENAPPATPPNRRLPPQPVGRSDSNASTGTTGSSGSGDMPSLAQRQVAGEENEYTTEPEVYSAIPDASPGDMPHEWLQDFDPLQQQTQPLSPSAPPFELYNSLRGLGYRDQQIKRMYPNLATLFPAGEAAEEDEDGSGGGQGEGQPPPGPVDSGQTGTASGPLAALLQQQLKDRLAGGGGGGAGGGGAVPPSIPARGNTASDVYDDAGDYSDEFDDGEETESSRQYSNLSKGDKEYEPVGRTRPGQASTPTNSKAPTAPSQSTPKGKSPAQNTYYNDEKKEYDNLCDLVADIRTRRANESPGAAPPDITPPPPLPPRHQTVGGETYTVIQKSRPDVTKLADEAPAPPPPRSARRK